MSQAMAPTSSTTCRMLPLTIIISSSTNTNPTTLQRPRTITMTGTCRATTTKTTTATIGVTGHPTCIRASLGSRTTTSNMMSTNRNSLRMLKLATILTIDNHRSSSLRTRATLQLAMSISSRSTKSTTHTRLLLPPVSGTKVLKSSRLGHTSL